MSAGPRRDRPPAAPVRSGMLALSLGSLGVVFGDIGTSPLYAFQEIFAGPHDVAPTPDRVYGAASLVFWTLTLVVSVKYVLVVMRADNDGEGGIMALAALATSGPLRSVRGRALLMALGIAGAALFYGDAMITPAVSVLSAVEGIGIATPSLAGAVVPIAVAVLVALFVVQRFGTATIGRAFGPVMLLWFVAIGALGLVGVVGSPRVLASVNPAYAVGFFVGEPWQAFLTLGSVVLCVTGAEALYADMGHFGRTPIRVSWFAVATPALYLTYLGQAALVAQDPGAAANPFYLLVPDALRVPMVVLATVATVIASQAVITGLFSMTRQAMHLDYLPRLTVRHTSGSERGQVYLPAVNWLLMVAVVGLVLAFQDSSNLASAYGIAVTGTFVITTTLITVVALTRWRTPWWIVVPVSVVFLVVDGSFFLANLTKFGHGGWFPLAVAAVVFTLLTTWRSGRVLLRARLAGMSLPVADFVHEIETGPPLTRTGEAAVYLAWDDGAPYALVHHVRMIGVMARTTVILRFTATHRPWVDDADRVDVAVLGEGIVRVDARFGFMERPDARLALRLAADHGLVVDPERALYVLNAVTVEPGDRTHMWLPRQRLYAAMQRNAADPWIYYDVPPQRVLTVGVVVRL